MPAVLPAEITDRIIDFLHDDKKTLKICSVVCRDWVPSTRTHIFSKIYISEANRRLFLDLLNGAPYIGLYAQDLSLFHVPGTHWMKIIKFCRNLSALRISLGTTDFDEFTKIVCSLPVLKVLWLSSLSLNPDKEPVLTPPDQLQLRVQSLTLHSVHYNYLTWFASQGLFPRVHTFEHRSVFIYGKRIDNALALCKFWNKFGSNLLHVRLHNLAPAPPQISEHFFDSLGQLCNLQDLVIDNLEIGRPESHAGFWLVKDVPRFLSSITSRCLKSILFGMRFFDGSNYAEDFDQTFIGVWEEVARTLETPQFSTVKTVGLGMESSVREKKSLYFSPLISLEQSGSLQLIWKLMDS